MDHTVTRRVVGVFITFTSPLQLELGRASGLLSQVSQKIKLALLQVIVPSFACVEQTHLTSARRSFNALLRVGTGHAVTLTRPGQSKYKGALLRLVPVLYILLRRARLARRADGILM
jgi:hypothetical protein